ncbi:MAG: ABC transporter ATP-binding protein [Streptosporangiaceae bacterium]
MPAADHGLTVTGLTGQAGSFHIGPIDLDVPAGRVLVVLGPSGAGKTMLLETIAGLRPHRSGQIRLAGADLTAVPPERRRIGLVFQDAALFPHLSVRDNVAFGPRATRQAPGPDAGTLLRRLGIAHLASRSPRWLSGGERQRVALARALAITPRLLLLDEPLSALDQPTREDMRVLLQELLAHLDIPAVHVTHDRDEALAIGDDLAVIADGQLRQTGPASHIAAEPASADVARLLGWSELGHGTAADGTVQAGQIQLPGAAPAGIRGPVHIFYRPEDVLLAAPAPGTPAGATLTAQIGQVLPTRPLARISLASHPPLTALMLHRDLERLHAQVGTPIQATLPPGGVRIFPAT